MKFCGHKYCPDDRCGYSGGPDRFLPALMDTSEAEELTARWRQMNPALHAKWSRSDLATSRDAVIQEATHFVARGESDVIRRALKKIGHRRVSDLPENLLEEFHLLMSGAHRSIYSPVLDRVRMMKEREFPYQPKHVDANLRARGLHPFASVPS